MEQELGESGAERHLLLQPLSNLVHQKRKLPENGIKVGSF
jgi:hypothetical protein